MNKKDILSVLIPAFNEETTIDAILGELCILEYDPREFRESLAPIRSGRADVVYGSRFMGSGTFTDE